MPFYQSQLPGNGATGINPAQQIILTPFFIAATLTFTQISVALLAASTTPDWDFGVYDNSGSLVANTGSVKPTPTGIKTMPIAQTSVTLPAGTYYFAQAPGDTSGRVGIFNYGYVLKGLSALVIPNTNPPGSLPPTITLPAPGVATDVRANVAFVLS